MQTVWKMPAWRRGTLPLPSLARLSGRDWPFRAHPGRSLWCSAEMPTATMIKIAGYVRWLPLYHSNPGQDTRLSSAYTGTVPFITVMNQEETKDTHHAISSITHWLCPCRRGGVSSRNSGTIPARFAGNRGVQSSARHLVVPSCRCGVVSEHHPLR